MHSTHTGHAWGAEVGGQCRREVTVTTLLPPRQMLKNAAGQMQMTPDSRRRSGGSGGVDGGVSAIRRGPVVPKGTLRAPVSPFQTTVRRYNRTTRAGLFRGGGAGSDKEEGEVEGEEEVSRPTTTDDHRQHSECKPPCLNI